MCFNQYKSLINYYYYLIVSDISFVGGANVVGPATRSRRHSDIHYGFHLLCPEL